MSVENSLTIRKLNKRIDELEACISIMSDNLTDMWEHMSEQLDGPAEIEGDTNEYLLELLEQNPAEFLGIRTTQKSEYNKQYYENNKEKKAEYGITRNVGKPKLTLV